MSADIILNGDVAVYADGSGKSSFYLGIALERLNEREEIVRTVRAFIAKHADTLAGLNWSVDNFDAEIKLNRHHYRGSPTTAKAVAKLWPGVEWKRVDPEYGIDKDTKRDWMAKLDGVDLRISDAEVYQPVKAPPAWLGRKHVDLGEEDAS